MKTLLYFSIFGMLFFGKISAQEEDRSSILRTESKYDLEETYDRLHDLLGNKEAISIFTEIDHAQNARSIGEDLPAAKLIIFGNPQMGTPLMQHKQLSGLDLPIKIMIWENGQGKTMLGYSDIVFLKTRYGLKSKDLRKIKKNLKKISRNVTGNRPEKIRRIRFRLHEEIQSLTSDNNFSETYEALKAAIEANENLKIFTEINHTQNAEDNEMGMRPTRLIIFGNPQAGTVLMQEKLESGLDLPLKMLVWRDDAGKVKVSWNSPKFFKKRYAFKENNVLQKMGKLQENLAEKAISASE